MDLGPTKTPGPKGIPDDLRVCRVLLRHEGTWADLDDMARISVQPCLGLPPSPSSTAQRLTVGWEVQPPWNLSVLGQEGRTCAMKGSPRWGQPSLPEDLESIPMRVPKADAKGEWHSRNRRGAQVAAHYPGRRKGATEAPGEVDTT